jgi:LruC domain-containing protein
MKKEFRFTYLILLLILIAVGMLSSCRKQEISQAVPGETSLSDIKVPAGFRFETTQPVAILVKALNNQDVPVPGVKISILTDYPENGGAEIVSGITDPNGEYAVNYKVAAMYNTLVVGTKTLGFPNYQKVSITGGTLQCTLGGKNEPSVHKSLQSGSFNTSVSNIYPMGTYNSTGVPLYLEAKNDVIDNNMIKDINASLPEYISLPNSHPQYFEPTNNPNLSLVQACDVWVTFVSEGAAYRNVLGYYKYNTNNPPATTADVDSIHIIFPNVSFTGSGGGLTAGNKVHLGIFAPGTTLAWVLIADGFRNGTITNGMWTVYSDAQLNPESNAAIRKHTILLNDLGREKFLLSFEDMRRDMSTDNDFNDAVFYVTANPIEAVNTTHIPLPDYTQKDTDHDGIPDNFDDYPNDPSMAFNNFYPTAHPFGTLAFEDMWPSRGDYDCNDMVIDYHFNQITNGSNKVVQIQAQFVVQAIGATVKNGFGIQLPINPAQVSSVTGTKLSENYIQVDPNGTEAGQTKATIILFDNGFHLLPHPDGEAIGVNTTPGAPYVKPDTINLIINLTSPVALSQIGLPPYNPFLIIDQKRGREVHLINNPPTDLADMSLFRTSADDSKPAEGRYYTTSNGLPWVMDVVAPFDYPQETSEISQTYLMFVPWAESGGQLYFDWYTSKSGYRNTHNIYTHQ